MRSRQRENRRMRRDFLEIIWDWTFRGAASKAAWPIFCEHPQKILYPEFAIGMQNLFLQLPQRSSAFAFFGAGSLACAAEK
jgi:hypothetical protein